MPKDKSSGLLLDDAQVPLCAGSGRGSSGPDLAGDGGCHGARRLGLPFPGVHDVGPGGQRLARRRRIGFRATISVGTPSGWAASSGAGWRATRSSRPRGGSSISSAWTTGREVRRPPLSRSARMGKRPRSIPRPGSSTFPAGPRNSRSASTRSRRCTGRCPTPSCRSTRTRTRAACGTPWH